jgi:transcriptional regulator with XRE-family HTH domain
MSFSSQVKELKKSKNINTEAIAELSGVPASTLNKILSNDDADPKISVVKAVARALECPIAYLIDGSGESVNETLSDAERELVRNYRSLDDYGRELVDTVMRMEADRAESKEKLQRSAFILQREGERRKSSLPTKRAGAFAHRGRDLAHERLLDRRRKDHSPRLPLRLALLVRLQSFKRRLRLMHRGSALDGLDHHRHAPL